MTFFDQQKIGHTSFTIRSGNSHVFVQSDVTSQEALFVRHPEWTAFVDQDAALAVEPRRIYVVLAGDRILRRAFITDILGSIS